MTTHVLIGIGGTGAKVVESALYLFLAGLGPSNVVVGLVDQDNANGNVERTRTLLADIGRVRAEWGAPGGNALDWTSAEADGGSVFARINPEPMFPGTPHWRPNADDLRTLSEILDRPNLSDDHKDLMDILFAPGPEEQDMVLDKGYRGRAHIGSAAMLASLELEGGVFKDRIQELMNQAKIDQDVRIFLVGSVFGGTGAAGFPTLSRAINKMREAMGPDAAEHIHIGGALMLPYFGFADPKDKDANVVRATELMPQARVALEYYHRLFEHERVFDRFSVAGWDRFFQLGYHEPGNREQRNPALLPELLGATAAVEFFTAPPSARPTKVPVMVSARYSQDSFEWRDLPQPSPDLRRTVYDRLGRLLRTAAHWRMIIEPELDKRVRDNNLKTAWMRDLVADTNFQVGTPEARKHLAALCNDVLVWAASIRKLKGSLKLDLWDTEDLLAKEHQATPSNPVGVHATMASDAFSEAYAKLLTPSDANDKPRTTQALYDELSERKKRAPIGGNKGLAKLLAAVHRATRPF